MIYHQCHPIKIGEETIAERVKLIPRKKNKGTRLKILTTNKLLTRFPILLMQIKAEIIHTS